MIKLHRYLHVQAHLFFFSSYFQCSCVDRKSSDLGLGGMRREYLQTDCAINAVTLIIIILQLLLHDLVHFVTLLL